MKCTQAVHAMQASTSSAAFVWSTCKMSWLLAQLHDHRAVLHTCDAELRDPCQRRCPAETFFSSSPRGSRHSVILALRVRRLRTMTGLCEMGSACSSHYCTRLRGSSIYTKTCWKLASPNIRISWWRMKGKSMPMAAKNQKMAAKNQKKRKKQRLVDVQDLSHLNE